MISGAISRTLRKHLLFIFLTIFIGLMAVPLAFGQSFDHQKHPKLDFKFQKLSLELGIQPQNIRIDGAAEYEISANINGADTLTLYASHLDISSVQVNKESAEFSLHNDSLFVVVDDSSEIGENYTVRIRYSGRPQFGLLKNASGTVWTSQLPRAERHWVPIVDNPNVTMQTEFNISVPSGNQVWATGKKAGEEVVSVEVMKYSFASDKPVPASALAFSVGDFRNMSASSGSVRVTAAVEKSITDTVDAGALTESARTYISNVANRLSMDYPFGALHIMVLDDHSWETKSWGANTVFVYQNRGDLETQLLRGIAAQWFGVYQREEQWDQADALTLYQTLLMNNISSDTLTLEQNNQPKKSFETIYDNFGPLKWNQWQQQISNWQEKSIRNFIGGNADEVLSMPQKVVSWEDYADYWYSEIGQPLYKMPELTLNKMPKSEQASDSVVYDVFYSLNEAEGQLELRFEAKKGVLKDLTTLQALEVYPNKTDESEVTFTGREDSVMLQVSPVISNLKLSSSDHPNLILNEYKPASFLLNQMENGETVEERAEAARRLGYHSDNPDLQLAIQDFMNRDLQPEIRAALLLSLGEITGGAAGTQQIFLDALKNDSKKIRDAGLMALQNYKENPSIVDRVESEAQGAEELSYFKKATNVLMAIAPQDRFHSFVQGIAQDDTVGTRSIFAIQELANMGDVEEAVERASLFTGEDYRYEIRSRALGILIQHDHTPANWIARGEELMSDPDPRIRFLVVEGMERNSNEEVEGFLKEYIQDEYDARVYGKIEQVLR